MDEMNDRKMTIDATRLLLDPDMERILAGTYEKSRSAIELSKIYGIPIAICHRKIKTLKKRGLLRTMEAIQDSRGKKHERYSANLENAYVYYDSGKIKVRFTVVLQMAEDFRRRFEKATSAYRKAEAVSSEANQI